MKVEKLLSNNSSMRYNGDDSFALKWSVQCLNPERVYGRWDWAMNI